MTRRRGRFARTVLLAVILLPPGILPPLSGTAHAAPRARAAGADAAESIAPERLNGEAVSPERLERWRTMSPEKRERIRERYRRWKELPPEQRERIVERHRRWKELPEEQRRYLKDRRELLKDAAPEDRVVVREFLARMRSLPPEARKAAWQKIREGRSLPKGKREETMRSLPLYGGLSDRERDTLLWFLFAWPGERMPRE